MTPEIADAGENGTARQAAERYLQRGWAVLPIPHRSKNPGFKGWERFRLTTESLAQHFPDRPQNIGVLLGEPSGWLIDVDLDRPRAVELAPEFLPPTPAIFGRAGKPRSHWLYRVTAPVATKKFRSKSAGMLVELRSTEMQTVFPPSTHESGEAICWEQEDHEPAEVDPALLLASTKRLADAVLIELGEKPAAKPTKNPPAPQSAVADSEAPQSVAMEERAACCLAALRRIHITDQRDGSHRLFTAACRIVEHNLDPMTALQVLREYARHRPFPRAWTDEEIQLRICPHEARDRGQVPIVSHDRPMARCSQAGTTRRRIRGFGDRGVLMPWLPATSPTRPLVAASLYGGTCFANRWPSPIVGRPMRSDDAAWR